MDPRTRSLTPRDHLARARALLEAGTPSRAFAHVQAALDLEPGSAEAQAMRDAILQRSSAEFPAEIPPAAPPVPPWMETPLASLGGVFFASSQARPVTGSPTSLLPSTDTPADRSAWLVTRARHLMARGRLQSARDTLASAREACPSNVDAAILLAEVAVLERRRRRMYRWRVALGAVIAMAVVLAGWRYLGAAARPFSHAPEAAASGR